MDPTHITHALATFSLFGLIWTIQLVHYPAFRFIEPPQWPRFHQNHSRNITFVVFPLMLVELLTSIQLFIESQAAVSLLLLSCSALVWLVTVLIFIPMHRSISLKPKMTAVSLLIRLNWIRTVTWTVATVGTFVHLLHLN